MVVEEVVEVVAVGVVAVVVMVVAAVVVAAVVAAERKFAKGNVNVRFTNSMDSKRI